MIKQQMVEWGVNGNTIREIAAYGAAKAAEIGEENVYNFALGGPSIDPPPCVQETIERLLRTMPPTVLHAYSPEAGLPEVRQKIADYLRNSFGVAYEAADIYMTHGSSSALTILFNALLGPGEEAVTLTPYFSEYQVFVEATGARLVEAPSVQDTFQPDLAVLERVIGPKTWVLILNSPNNPSGVVLREDSIRAVAALLERKSRACGHPIYMIADEPYRELVYDGITVPFIPRYYRDTLYCYSFSKSISLPGERAGFLAVPPESGSRNDLRMAVLGAGRALGYICMSTLFQRVAAECIGQTSDMSLYKANRDLICGALREMGFRVVPPDGAFYLFIRSPESDSRSFCLAAREENILLVPGDDFSCPGYARLAYCVPKERLERSLPAFRRLAERYGLC